MKFSNGIFRTFAVTQAASGDAALKAIADIAELDVAILDFNMPGMDGLNWLMPWLNRLRCVIWPS